MTSGRKGTATILKLIRGGVQPCRRRDDRPVVEGIPLLPPGTVLTADERAVWDYLLANVYVPRVHGTADGAAFLKVARLLVH